MPVLSRIRQSATAAHVLPLMLFMAFTTVPGWFRIENSELPWYQRAPEHWVYPLQTIIIGALLLWFRQHYRPAPWRGYWLAVVLAVAGIAAWVAPQMVYARISNSAADAPDWWGWLGLVDRREGFDPTVLSAWPTWEMATILMRFVRMVVIVPWVEELCWRGFLMRYVIAGDRDWTQVAFGTHHWRAFWIVTLAVTLVHNPEDYLAAFVWGALTYLLAVRTRSLGACVIMHAVGNLLLGIYVLQTRQWGFW